MGNQRPNGEINARRMRWVRDGRKGRSTTRVSMGVIGEVVVIGKWERI
jgi:hypothetical protein